MKSGLRKPVKKNTKTKYSSQPKPAHSDDEDSDSPSEDQAAALLKGFESDSESEEPQEEDPTTSVTATPATTLEDTTPAATSDSNVVYIGRIPHGFYEHQMLSYFSQFGTITRLRLARNRRTGAPKHYAFAEFEAPGVARIVADTMDNYLLFNHMLKVKVLSVGQLAEMNKDEERVFKGVKKGSVVSRFKKMPWNRIERFKAATSDRVGWGKRVEREQKRRKDKMEKLKEMGYEFDAPELEQVPQAAAVEESAAVPLLE